LNQGDIILFPIQQADGKLKPRPVLLLKQLPGHGDWLGCGISTQLHEFIQGFDLILDLSHTDFKASGLKLPGVIRLGFLSSIPSQKILGAIGNLSDPTVKELLKNLSNYLLKEK